MVMGLDTVVVEVVLLTGVMELKASDPEDIESA
jgi:hypothetical protein